jgi:hypothetical protein
VRNGPSTRTQEKKKSLSWANLQTQLSKWLHWAAFIPTLLSGLDSRMPPKQVLASHDKPPFRKAGEKRNSCLWAIGRVQDLMNTFWVYEILASLLSLVMLAAIFGVLHHYNSSDIDLWSHSWALSSLVGLLATINQTTLAFPLDSCISQLKWTW